MKTFRGTGVVVMFFVLMFEINLFLVLTGDLKTDPAGIGTMIAAGMTIALFSFLYADNPLYKLAEHFFVGVSAAYLLVANWYEAMQKMVLFGYRDIFSREFDRAQLLSFLSLTTAVIMGLLLFTRSSKKTEWLSRISFAFIMGFGAGMAIPNSINTSILQQLKPTLEPLWTQGQFLSWGTFGAVVVFVGVITTLVYFFFSVEHKGVVGVASRTGIFFLMVAFGASFGFTVMARISLLIGRTMFLFQDWLPVIPR